MTPPSAHRHFEHDYVLHLPGIAGARSIDRSMVGGLRDGGFDGQIDIYDWTGDQAGLGTLLNRKRNDEQAEQIASKIVTLEHEDPLARVVIISHSGGTGLIIWALEKLPSNVKVESVILLSSALSPQYDLSQALRHVRGHLYSYYSENDRLVLSVGTRMFGTIDGVKCDAAGECGFQQPQGADGHQYHKLIQVAYDPAWLQYGNDGDHIGTLSRQFAQHVVADVVMEEFDPSFVPLLPPVTGHSGAEVSHATDSKPAKR